MIVEIIVELVIEIVIQFFVEILVEVGVDTTARSKRSAAIGPIVGTVVYLIVGIVLGVAASYIWPGHFVRDPSSRLAGRIASPVVMGLGLCLISWIVQRRDIGEGFFSMNKFVQGIIFGAAYTFTRAMMIGI